MKAIATGLVLAAMLVLLVGFSTPVSAETTVADQARAIEQAGQMVEVDTYSELAQQLYHDGWTISKPSPTGQSNAIPPDHRFSDGDLDLAFEDGYLAGVQDAIEDPDGARDTLVDTCSAKGGVVAEDLSCIMNPEQFWGPEPDDDVAGEFALPATH